MHFRRPWKIERGQGEEETGLARRHDDAGGEGRSPSKSGDSLICSKEKRGAGCVFQLEWTFHRHQCHVTPPPRHDTTRRVGSLPGMAEQGLWVQHCFSDNHGQLGARVIATSSILISLSSLLHVGGTTPCPAALHESATCTSQWQPIIDAFVGLSRTGANSLLRCVTVGANVGVVAVIL